MKASSSELYRWLKRQESEGTLDSSGHFTLDQSRAWEKLGALQLPFPHAWVLKVVQSARAAGVDLKITQNREDTVFQLGVSEAWRRKELESSIFSPEQQVSRALEHMAIAIRALIQLKTRPFSLQYPSGEHFAWNGKGFEAIPSGERAETLLLSVANFEFGESRLLFSPENIDAASFRAEIRKVLSDHCHFGPESLKVDSSELASFLTDPHLGVTPNSRPLTLLRSPVLTGLPTFTVRNPELFKPEALGIHTVSLESLEGGPFDTAEPCSVAALLSVFVERKHLRRDTYYYTAGRESSEVLWLLDGVVIQREDFKLRGPVGLGLILSAEGLQTDLSGFQLRSSSEKDERLKRAQEVLLPLLQNFQESLGTEGVQVDYELWKTVVKGLLGGVLTFVIPVLGLALLTKAGYEYSAAHRHAEELDKTFDDGLQKLVEGFRDLTERQE